MIARMRSAAFPPRRPSALVRFILPACLMMLGFLYLGRPSSVIVIPSAASWTRYSTARHSHQASAFSGWRQEGQQPIDIKKPEAPGKTGAHPIDGLIDEAQRTFSDLLAKESHTIAEAAAAYRRRRGRHPPPGFDQWYQFAREHDAVMVEDFWDQIYHDLNPFWALPAAQLRREAREFEMTINIRSGNATAQSDWFWTQIWLKLIKTIEHLLPDMDLALNAMDEPRLVVPWEKMRDYMAAAEKTAKVVEKTETVIDEFQRLPSPEEGRDEGNAKVQDKKWEKTSEWAGNIRDVQYWGGRKKRRQEEGRRQQGVDSKASGKKKGGYDMKRISG